MKEVSAMNMINYANSAHHREKLRKDIDPAMIDRIEISEHPSMNYRNAFKGIYQDEL